MLGFAAIASAILIVGVVALGALWRRLDGESDLTTPERLSGGAVLGLGIWIAMHWALALSHTLTRATILAVAGLFLLAASIAAARHWRRLRGVEVERSTGLVLLFLMPVLLWTIFILWRGSILPPLSHDALAYHLPKAVLMMRAHGFGQFAAPDPRIGAYPANYELLLTDVLALSGTDRLTEWIGTASFLLFLAATAALAMRWWRGRTGALAGAMAAMLAVASAPVVLLHSGADKNDLLMAFFMLTALLFGSRWCVHGGRMPMALLILSLVLGVGTKFNVAAIGFALAPFLAARWWRLLRDRQSKLAELGATAALSVIAFLLCGGWAYLANWTAHGAPVGIAAGNTIVAPRAAPIAYGDWFNYWQFPYLLLTIPFAPSQHGVWVPWAGEYWFWPHYEIYWSHYGYAFTLAVLVLPFSLWRYRTHGDTARERRIAGLVALIALAIMLPVMARPIGFYGTFPRYLVFIVPVVHAFSLAPLVDELMERRRKLAYAALTIAASLVVYYAVLSAEKDRFAPMEFVVWAMKHPGTRDVPFMQRAATVADRRAGPYDKIYVDGAFDTWVYPAYGARLTREVVFLPAGATASDVPDDADWVVVDRSWRAIWGHERMQTMGNMWKHLTKGTPAPEDVRLTDSLRGDPRFRLVYDSRQLNQAVFRRERHQGVRAAE
jgi:hypothetical protein